MATGAGRCESPKEATHQRRIPLHTQTALCKPVAIRNAMKTLATVGILLVSGAPAYGFPEMGTGNIQSKAVDIAQSKPGTSLRSGGKELAGFLLSGFLLALLGAILPAWGYHRDPPDFIAV